MALIAVAALGSAAATILLPVFNLSLMGLVASVAVFLVALVVAVLASGGRRAYWLGFDAFGAVYVLGLLNVPSLILRFAQILERLGLLFTPIVDEAAISFLFLLPALFVGHLGGMATRWFFRRRDAYATLRTPDDA